jgi:cytoskeletal protein CcmA (bactofilin family)
MADEPINTPPEDENALESPDDSNALEGSSTADNSTTPGETSSGDNTPAAPGATPKTARQRLKKFNIYLLLFIFVLLMAAVIIALAYFQSKKESTTSTIKTQELTDNALQQVTNSDATVGSSQAVLNVQSSAVFAGKVLVRDDLQVAGSLQIGGTVALTDLTVSGATQLGSAQVSKDLSVTGNTSIQGTASITKSLQVNGTGTFSGNVSAPQITTPSLQLNGDLVLTRHIVAGGSTPSRTNGTALGSGGSSSVSGSDTTGTVSVNIGSNPAAGCFATITFTSRYNSTPHVLLTPVGSAAGSLDYYVTRTATNFSVCVASPASVGSSFAFDYFVIN